MPNPAERWDDNAPGKFYIDKTCDYCEVCMDEAPDNIKPAESGDHCIVFKQPENEQEEEALRNAMGVCPSESIGDDGA